MWRNNCPRKIGFRNFIAKYFRLFPERVERYAKDHWMLTQELIEHGKRIVNKTYTHPSMLVLFLLKVGVWKNPHGVELEKTIANIASNRIEDIKSVFDDGLSIYWSTIKDKEEPSEYDDGRLIDTFGKLKGFGRKTESRKMTSAVLRFLDPTKYGTVDYRNWCILSNTEFMFLDKPLLEPLANTWKESKNIDIDTRKYLAYLKAIRKLGRKYGFTPAEVDMALFAYSDEIIPLKRESSLTTSKSKEKAHAMMKIVQEVADSARKVGFPHQAERLINMIKPLVREGRYEDIYRLCIKIVSSRPDMDEKIERRGGKSLRSQLPRIKEIYEDSATKA